MQKLLELIYPLLVTLVFTLLFFTGLGKPVVIDYDESAYAEVSRTMFHNGDLIVPELNGKDFLEKPPLLYWLQSAGYRLFGVSAFGARFFNTFCALLTLLVFYFAAKNPLGARTAFNATLVLGSSIIFSYLSRVAMTDMSLTLFITMCLVLSWYGVERALENRGGAILFWLGCLCSGLAMLSEGAVGVLFPLLTVIFYLLTIGRITILFRKNWIIPGTILLVLAGFSWYLLLGVVHPDGFSFAKDLFVKNNISRFVQAQGGHTGPIFYYLLVLLVGFMPWFSYLPLATSRIRFKRAKEPGTRFLLLFFIFSLVVLVSLSLTATKMPNYILPAMPGFALLAAVLFNTEEIKHPLAWKISGWLSMLLPVLVGLVFAALPFLFPYLPELLGDNARKAPALAEPVNLGSAPWLAALLFLISGFLIFTTLRKNEPGRMFESLLLSAFINALAIFFIVIPLYDRLLDAPLTRLAVQAAELTPADGKIVMYGIKNRPSVNFVSERTTIHPNTSSYQDLPEVFKGNGSAIGLTTVYYFEHLQSRLVGVAEIARDTGFILFQPAPGNSPDRP